MTKIREIVGSLTLNRMKDQSLIIFNRSLQLPQCNCFIGTVGNQNASWPVKEPRVISLERGDICPIIHHSCFKAWDRLSLERYCLIRRLTIDVAISFDRSIAPNIAFEIEGLVVYTC